jgi:phosphoesterase RecJ-like protein
VTSDISPQFDLSIIVDASTYTLLEKLDLNGQLQWVKSKPCIVLDHHATVEHKIDFTHIQIIDEQVASTGELIFKLAKELNWFVNPTAGAHIMSSILGDTQGLMNDLTTANTYRIMAELCDLGVSRPQIEEQRRLQSKMPPKIYAYKGILIAKTEFAADERIAYVHVPQDEINEFSPLYNPAALVQFDMLQITDVVLGIVFKTYDDGRITAALRGNNGFPICGKLAEHMGGGGHDYASGFKVTDGRTYAEVKAECLAYAQKLLETSEN